MTQQVWVQATMGQRYNGVHKGSGDKFQMLDTDAADSVALRMVSRLKPEEIPGFKVAAPVATTRNMESNDGPTEQTDTAPADAAPQAPQQAQTATAARANTPQPRYPQRNMQSRRS